MRSPSGLRLSWPLTAGSSMASAPASAPRSNLDADEGAVPCLRVEGNHALVPKCSLAPWRPGPRRPVPQSPPRACQCGHLSPYFRIGVAPQGSSFLRCLQGDLGGPWARPLPSSPVTRTSLTRVSCRLPWVATPTSSRTSARWRVPGSPQRRRQRRRRRLVALRVHREQRTLGTWLPSAAGDFLGLDRIPSRRGSPAAAGSASTSRGRRTTPGVQLQTWRCNGTLAQQFLGRPERSGRSSTRRYQPGSARGLDWPV